MVHFHSWIAGRHNFVNKKGVSIRSRSDNHVPVAAGTKQRGILAHSDAGGNSLPDWLQPFAEGLRDEGSEDEVSLAKTTFSKHESDPNILLPLVFERRTTPNERRPTSSHNVYITSPKTQVVPLAR